jgi:hypothetical protein
VQEYSFAIFRCQKRKNGRQGGRGRVLSTYLIRDDFVIKEVHYCAEKECTSRKGHPGNIGGKLSERYLRGEIPPLDIGRALSIRESFRMTLTIPIFRMASFPNTRIKEVLTHDPCDPLMVKRSSFNVREISSHPLGSIAIAYLFLDVLYLLSDRRVPIGQGTRMHEAIIAASWNFRDLAEQRHLVASGRKRSDRCKSFFLRPFLRYPLSMSISRRYAFSVRRYSSSFRGS